MTEQEQNTVNRVKMAIARMVIDFDDDMLLEIIKKAIERSDKDENKNNGDSI